MDGSVTNRGLLRAALVLALTLFGLFVIWQFVSGIATAMLVFLAGLLLAVALSGPVEALHRRKVPRAVASAAIVLGVLGVLGLGGYLFLPVLAEQVWQLVSALPYALSRLGDLSNWLAERTGLPIGGGGGPSFSTLASFGRRVLGGALGLFDSLTALVFGLVVAILVPLYLAANPEPVVGWTLRLFPPGRRPRAREVLSKVRLGLLGWLKARSVSMAVVGALWTVALHLLGIPGALFLGIFAGLLGFVPYVGPIISVVPPVVLALAGNPANVLWVLLSYLGIQQVEGYLLKPLVEGKITSLHPAVVVVSVTLAGSAFGFLGVLLAVPATVVAKVLIEELWFRRMEDEPEAPKGAC